MRAVVDAALGDVDRHVADQPHAALGGVVAQRRPLALEAHLVVDARRRRPPSPRSSSAFARRNAARSRAVTARVRLREQAVPGRERGGGRVRRADLVRRAEREHLPPALPGRREPVDERVGVRVEPAARERGRVQHDPAGSSKLHRLFEVRRSLKVTEPCPTLRQATAAPHPDPGRPAPGRLRTLSRQGDRTAIASSVVGDDLQRRARRAPRRRPLPAGRLARVARGAARAARQRPLARQLRADGARPLAVHDRGLGRPLRDAARRARPQGRRRADRARGRALRGRGALRARDAGRVARRRARSRARRTGTASVARRSRSRSTSTASAPASAPGTSSSRARWGGFEGVAEAAAAAGRARLRRRLPAADPPDRRRRTARAATTR